MKAKVFSIKVVAALALALSNVTSLADKIPVQKPIQGQSATSKRNALGGAVTIAPLGDSRTAIIAYDGAAMHLLSTQNHLNWANALNQQKYPYTGNFGVSAATSDMIVANLLPLALATHPTHMTILMGVNDPKLASYNAEHTMANIAKAANAALAQGTIPIVFTDPGADHYNAAQVAFINDVNTRIKDYCAATPKAVLFDMAALISEQRTPAIVFHPGWVYDGVHLQTLGAYKIGVAFAALMDSLGAEAPVYPGVSGNLLENSALSGTGGAVGKGNTGILPGSFAATDAKPTNPTAFALNKRKDGTTEIVATLTNADPKTLNGVRISQPLPVTGLNPGDSFQAGVQVDIDKGSVNLGDVRAEMDLNFTDGTFASVYDFETSMAREGKPTRDTISSLPVSDGVSLTLQAPTNAYPVGKVLSGMTFRLGARIAGQGSATVRFRNPWCKKVVSLPERTGERSGAEKK